MCFCSLAQTINIKSSKCVAMSICSTINEIIPNKQITTFRGYVQLVYRFKSSKSTELVQLTCMLFDKRWNSHFWEIFSAVQKVLLSINKSGWSNVRVKQITRIALNIHYHQLSVWLVVWIMCQAFSFNCIQAIFVDIFGEVARNKFLNGYVFLLISFPISKENHQNYSLLF